MSKNVSGADNQQETKPSTQLFECSGVGSSETIRRAPLVSRREVIAYLSGAAHDATINKRRRIRFAQKYPEWLRLLQQLLDVLGYNSWIYKEGKDREVYVLETLCPEVRFDFKPAELSRKVKIAYLRGFFDAEGGVPRNGKRFYIQLVQKDRTKIELVAGLLSEIGIECGKIHNPSVRIDPDYWRVYVLANSHGRFASVVGSYHPIKARILAERG